MVANTRCHDPRFDAGVILAERQGPFPEGEFFVRIDTPLLLAHGDADSSVPYADGRLAYLDAPPPKFLVTLLGGDHGEPFTGSPDVPHAQVVAVATLDFWDQQFRGAPDDLERLRDHSEVAGVSRFDGEV
ncbi:hypothetical protein BH23ACT1_BH23ACT1_15770 [soil metagenome]